MEEKNTPRILLVVADDSKEMEVALRYAAMRARSFHGRVALLKVYEKPEMQLWRGVEQTISDTQRRQAEKRLQELATIGFELSGYPVIFYEAEGNLAEALLLLLRSDASLSTLVLAASKGNKGPGPLINYLSGRGLAQLPVPLVIVPEDFVSGRAQLIKD